MAIKAMAAAAAASANEHGESRLARHPGGSSRQGDWCCGDALVSLLFACSGWLRRELPHDAPALAYVLSFMGTALALVTAWLDGELAIGSVWAVYLTPTSTDTVRTPNACYVR